MMNDQLFLKISGTEPTSPNAVQSWIKLTLDPPEKTSEITKAQLADWLDNAVGIEDHCTGATAEDAYDPADTEDSVEQRLQAALGGGSCYEAADLLAMQEQCSLTHRAGVPKKFNVYVHCSSETIRERYRFKSSSSFTPTGPTRGEKIIQVIIDFTDAGEVPIYRYAESEEVNKLWETDGYRPQWLGDVLVGTRRVDPDTIGVGWINGRVVLSEHVSGRLVVYLPIQYDSWGVSVPGVIIGGKRDYTATAYAFDESLDEPASVDLNDEQDNPEEGSDCELCSGDDSPVAGFLGRTDDDEDEDEASLPDLQCQLRTDWEKRNQCTGDLLDYGTRYSDTQCPDKRKTETTYTNEGTPDSAKWSEAEYQEACCEGPKRTGCLPCKKVIRTYTGGAPILPSEQYWRDRYAPAQVIFNRVGREDGLPCGNRVDEFVGPDNCCDGVSDIVYDEVRSPDEVAEGWQGVVYFSGGRLPCFVALDGTGFYLDPEGTQTEGNVDNRSITIYARNSCGACEITVSDDCGNQDTGVIRSSEGRWVTISDTLTGDGSYGSCIIGRYRYTDDWCDNRPGSNTCIGTGTQYCTRPPEFDPEAANSIEGNKIEEWRC